jgi:hypothetical protein
MTELPDRTPKLVPLLVAAVGAPAFLAFWIGGRPLLGAVWGGLSVLFGLLLALGGRSDTLRMLRGGEDDERTMVLEYKAMTAVALVLVVALAGLFLAAGVRGESGLVYGALLITAEVVHVAGLALLNRRS